MFEFIVKPVPIMFVVLGGVKVEAESVFSVLENFEGDDYVHSCDLDTYIADILIKEGVLEKHIGSRMATLYKKTDKFEDFYNQYKRELFKEK